MHREGPGDWNSTVHIYSSSPPLAKLHGLPTSTRRGRDAFPFGSEEAFFLASFLGAWLVHVAGDGADTNGPRGLHGGSRIADRGSRIADRGISTNGKRWRWRWRLLCTHRGTPRIVAGPTGLGLPAREWAGECSAACGHTSVLAEDRRLRWGCWRSR
jgi:hypothetical protein